MTITGHRLPGYPAVIESRQAELETFYKKAFPEKAEDPKQIPSNARQTSQSLNCDWRERLRTAFNSKNGAAIKRLYDGEISGYPSQSEADMALCSHLAFWLNGDAAVVDSAFRESGLYREKWDQKHYRDGRTYGAETVAVAISGCREFYKSPSQEDAWGCAESQKNSLDAAIQRLAALSLLQYDHVRKTEAKAIGVRPGTLDAAVKEARKGSNADCLPFTEVDPWPEPINPATLLTDIAETIRRFIVCSAEVSRAVALWVAMTWFIEVVQVAPYAFITSPEKRCGKSLLLSLLRRLSARAIVASNISPAATYRTIATWQPTLLIDEADSFLKDNEELRGVLNSGHTRDSAYVIVCVGDNHTPTKFNTWGAKAIAGIGYVADTLMDRSIILELRRKLPHEGVDRLRYAEPGLFEELSSKLARFAEDFSEKVRQARPPLPNNLNDRAQDNWEPLLAIAMTAGNEWLQIGTTAALKLSGGESASQTIGTELLSDIHEIFEEKQIDRITSADLIKALCTDDEKLWATYNRGLPIKPRQLATKLKGYGIQSKTIRIGHVTAKGYEREQLKDAFIRYAVPSPENIRHTSQPAPVNDLRDFQSVTQKVNVTEKNQGNHLDFNNCYPVTDKNPLPGEKNNAIDLQSLPFELEEEQCDTRP